MHTKYTYFTKVSYFLFATEKYYSGNKETLKMYTVISRKPLTLLLRLGRHIGVEMEVRPNQHCGVFSIGYAPEKQSMYI